METYRFESMPGHQNVVMWISKSGSGVVTPDSPAWEAYQRYLRNGGIIASQPVMQTRAQAMATIQFIFDGVVGALNSHYCAAEIESWPSQVMEARAYKADASAHTPLLDAILLPQEQKGALCDSILAQSDAYAERVGEAIMWRRIATAAIDSLFEKGPRHDITIRYREVPSAS